MVSDNLDLSEDSISTYPNYIPNWCIPATATKMDNKLEFFKSKYIKKKNWVFLTFSLIVS